MVLGFRRRIDPFRFNMGCKRPFEEMEFEDLCFKQPRQLEVSNKPASFSELFSLYNTHQEPFVTGKDDSESCKYQWTETYEKENAAKASTLVEKDFMTGNPLSVVANRSGGERSATISPFGELGYPQSPGYYDFGFPRMSFDPVEDAYSTSLNVPPRKQVPIGPNHQASIPIWRGNTNEIKGDRRGVLRSRASFSHSLDSDVVDNYNEEKIMGTCVIPMPDSNLSAQESVEVGIGRTKCGCLDAGSVSCVRQHVEESRENLRKSLGDKKFVNLGFCEMGEEVSFRWSEEEELDFHEVVYSKPVSSGRNFWKRLSAVFPSRSEKEIVSYYFNVFMLRKRASQNRSRLLDIDSDDDEWHGSNGAPREVQDSEDDDDSAIESLGDQDDRRHQEEDFSEEESDDDDSTDGSDDCDDTIGHDRGDAAKEHVVIDHISESFMPKLIDGCQFDTIDKISDNSQDGYVFQDDSCMSFECQANTSDSCSPYTDGASFHKASQSRTENNKNPHSKPEASPSAGDHLYLSDPLDSKVWDLRYNYTRPAKNFDDLPWDMIEDIFGEGKDDCKSGDN